MKKNKRTFRILSADTVFKNNRVTVVKVVIEDKITGYAYEATARAFRDKADAENENFGFYLAKARAVLS